jgi:hypothetical protein
MSKILVPPLKADVETTLHPLFESLQALAHACHCGMRRLLRQPMRQTRQRDALTIMTAPQSAIEV